MKYIISLLILSAVNSLTAQGFNKPENRQGPPPPPDPAEIAAFVLGEFDLNATGGLDVAELVEALTFLHNNRPPPPPDAPQKAKRDRPEPDHARLGADLESRFDGDQNGELTDDELVAAFTFLNERMRHHRG